MGCQWRFLFLSFFPFFFVPCMLATFAWELNTTVRTSMTVKDLYHLFQFRREEVQADMLTSLIFVFMILSVSKHFCTSYTNNSRLSKNKQQPRTVWCLIFYLCIQTVHIGFRSRNTKIPLWIMLVFLALWKRVWNKIISLARCHHLYIKIVVLELLSALKLRNVQREDVTWSLWHIKPYFCLQKLCIYEE